MPSPRQRGQAPTNPAAVEAELVLLADHLEALTDGGFSPVTGDEITGHTQLARTAADAEVDWKVNFAQEMLRLADEAARGGKRAERKDLMEQRATVKFRGLLRDYKRTAAEVESARLAARTAMARMEALRTVAVNHREQT